MKQFRKIRVRLEYVGENGEPDEPAGEALIERQGEPADVADYAWLLMLADVPHAKRGNRSAWRHGTLKAFPRKPRGHKPNAFDLVYRVLRQAVHFRNRGGEP